MRLVARAVALVVLSLLSACPGAGPSEVPTAGQGADPQPPVAQVSPQRLEAHGQVRVDDYYWLRQRDDPAVLAYLEAENDYTAAMTAHTAELRASLEREMAGRIQQDDSSVPVRERDYAYLRRWQQGADFPQILRRGLDGAGEAVILDLPTLAAGHEFYDLGDYDLSESQQLLAYADDVVGRRIYTIHVVDLRSGAALADEIPSTAGTLVWANDDRHLFYTRQDPQTLRDYQVLRHELGTDPATDAVVYEEADETYDVWLEKSKSRRFLFIGSSTTMADEVRFLEAGQPTGALRLVQGRERGLEYTVDHLGDDFYVRTNLEAENFRLMRAPVASPDKANWREVVPERPGVLLESVDLFRDHLVLTERRRGLIELRVRRLRDGDEHVIDFGEPAYLAYATGNLEIDSHTLRFAYESMTTPPSWFDYDLDARSKQLRKQTAVLGGFAAEDYVGERLEAPAPDGTLVPISLVYRRSWQGREGRPAGDRPLLLYGYGAYGSSLDAEFDAEVLSLLDRGFVYAIAHVRGGAELGRAWYEDGKLLHKRNSFTDFIACAEHLVAEGYADPQRLFASGGSAGGLLIGAVVDLRPELFTGAIAAVPFVDVVTTMLDPSIPLTTSEYDEWGDPNQRIFYDYMLGYSPYDNVEAKAYPHLLVTTSLHDSQVQYWEPAKWVAKLRARKTDDHLLLLRTDMNAGHGGKAGRLAALEDVAFEWAFLLDLAARGETPRAASLGLSASLGA